MFGSIALAAALSLFTAPQTTAQDPQAAAPLPEVVVERQSLEEVVRGYVDEVADPLPGRAPARWDGRVCVGVANLRPEVAQYMIDRVSQIAMEIGLEPGEPGCRPNILIVAAADGQEMARALVEVRPRLFYTGVSGANRSRQSLEEFQSTDAPVRWWHVSLPVDSDTGEPATQLPGYDPPAIRNFTASRLRTQIRNELRAAYIIVDFTRARGTNIVQISDYAAMVALAQVDPDADTAAYDTVLNVFNAPTSTPGITDWDMSYLKALYSAELNQRSTNAQRGEIASGMTDDRRSSGDDDEDDPAPRP